MRETRLSVVRGRWSVVLLAGAGAAMLAALVGCDNEDASSVALRTASNELSALMPRSAVPASDAHARNRYQSIIQDMRAVTADGNKTQKASANLVISRARYGLALPKAEAVQRLQADLRARINISRAIYGRLLTHRALEQAASAYNPAPELAEIDTETARIADEIAATKQAKTAVDGVVAKLLTEAASNRDQSRQLRAVEADLRRQVLTTDDYGEAARLMEQTQKVRRNADQFEITASDLEARAARAAPESEEIQRQIDRLRNQGALLFQSRADVLTRAQATRDDAAEAAAHVTEVSGALAQALTELAQSMADDMPPAVEQALAPLRSSASAASQARGVARGPAGAALGQARQSIGDLRWSTAEVYKGYAVLLGVLAGVEPPLVGVGDLAAQAQTARDAYTEQILAAAESYQQAADASSGDLADALRTRGDTLAALGGEPTAQPEEDPADLDPPAEPDEGDAAGEGDQSG